MYSIISSRMHWVTTTIAPVSVWNMQTFKFSKFMYCCKIWNCGIFESTVGINHKTSAWWSRGEHVMENNLVNISNTIWNSCRGKTVNTNNISNSSMVSNKTITTITGRQSRVVASWIQFIWISSMAKCTIPSTSRRLVFWTTSNGFVTISTSWTIQVSLSLFEPTISSRVQNWHMVDSFIWSEFICKQKHFNHSSI